MVRKFIITLLGLALAMSGCADLPGEADEGLDASESAEPAGTEAPSASLTANRTSGQAPAKVFFTLDGEAPDQDGLEWTFDPGDGTGPSTGEQLPTSFEHAYETPGEYVATLSVEAGGESDEAQWELTIEEADARTAGDGGTEQSPEGPEIDSVWKNATVIGVGHEYVGWTCASPSPPTPPSASTCDNDLLFDVGEDAEAVVVEASWDADTEVRLSVTDPDGDERDVVIGEAPLKLTFEGLKAGPPGEWRGTIYVNSEVPQEIAVTTVGSVVEGGELPDDFGRLD